MPYQPMDTKKIGQTRRGDWEAFLDEANGVIALMEDLPERAEDFAGSCISKIEDIMDTVETRERVTEGQWQALDNMRSGAERWIR